MRSGSDGSRKKHVASRAESPSSWWVYIARCADGTLYTGIARDVEARMAQHNAGKGAKYTRGRSPVTLEAVLPQGSQGDALRFERAVKRLTRVEKEALIRKTVSARRSKGGRRGAAVDPTG